MHSDLHTVRYMYIYINEVFRRMSTLLYAYEKKHVLVCTGTGDTELRKYIIQEIMFWLDNTRAEPNDDLNIELMHLPIFLRSRRRIH